MSKYDDIINLPHPISRKHKTMPNYARAGQFAPFAALTGYEELIGETGRTVDQRLELNEDQIVDINSTLIYLTENKDIEATYTIFVKDNKKQGGKYIDLKGSIKKIDLDNHRLILNDGSIIPINDLVSIIVD